MNGYLLIGGHSRRMGRSKSDLFLDRVAAVAREAFDRVIAVQRTGGDAARELETIFESAHDDEAPAFGVLTALEHARERCFILAVDYPLVTPEILCYLQTRSCAPLVMPRWSGELQTLCAVYDAPVVGPRLAARIAAGTFDLRGLIDEVESEIIEEAELRATFGGEPLMNVNTPEELEEVSRR
jgi:molybdopterin-guanine dinucleotide biosynthesis protein A